jgi:hypothetical protein
MKCYEYKLRNNIPNISPVFHVSLLKKRYILDSLFNFVLQLHWHLTSAEQFQVRTKHSTPKSAVPRLEWSSTVQPYIKYLFITFDHILIMIVIKKRLTIFLASYTF